MGDLFRAKGRYTYRDGWNPTALIALVVGVLPNLPGFLHQAGLVDSVASFFDAIYTYAWFVGLLGSGGLYAVLSWGQRGGAGGDETEEPQGA